MTKGSSLGSITSNTRQQTIPTLPTTVVRGKEGEPVIIEVNPSLVDKIRYNQSSILCCILTTILVGSGIGIAIWYAIVEI